MKIICESRDEYEQLMKASRYLHDFDFNDDKYLNMDDPIINLLCHIYLDGRDFPNKKDMIKVRYEDGLEVNLVWPCPKCHEEAERTRILEVDPVEPVISVSSFEQQNWKCPHCGYEMYSDDFENVVAIDPND